MIKYNKEKRLLHGGDYNPDQWLNQPNILADDLNFMQEVRANTFSVGIFAWSALEPSEGQFEFAWLDKIMDDLAAMGANAILATPSGARPVWMAQKYPEVLRVNAQREKLMYGGRHNHCHSSPIYREKVAIINGKLAERYKDHPALLMWHISNEYCGDCHCDLCQERFRQWLKEKYGTIEALNAAYWSAFWSHSYNDFSQIESPSPIGELGVHALNLDWNRFVTHQTIDFYKHEIQPMRRLTPDVPCITNFMGEVHIPGIFNGLDYSKFAKEVDIVAWDSYPHWHNDYEREIDTAAKVGFVNDYFRTLKDKPFLILESTPSMVNWHPINKPKRPGMHLLSSAAFLAHGSDSVMYFQWRKSRGSTEKFHGAVIDHDNSPSNRVFKEVQAVGETLEAAKEIKGSKTMARVAVIYDPEDNWALQDAQGFHRADKKYMETVFAHYRPFYDRNIPVDVISKDKDLAKYELVIAPMMYMVDDKLSARLDEYTKNGGTLVSTYVSGMVNETDLVHPGSFHPMLSDIFGIQPTEIDVLYPTQKNALTYEGETFEVADYCAVVDILQATAMAEYTSDFYAKTPAVTQNRYGKGKAWYIACHTGQDFLNKFYHDITKNMTIDLFASPIKPVDEVSIQTRVVEDGDSFADWTRYHFVMNFSRTAKTIDLPWQMTNLITGKTLSKGRHEIASFEALILK